MDKKMNKERNELWKKFEKILETELIKHLLGIWGEPHINIFTILMSTPIVSYIIYKLYR